MNDELTSALEARVIEQSDRISALLSEKADATAWAKDEQHKRHAAEEKLLVARSKLETFKLRLTEAAARVCHEEQMTVWSGEVIEALSMGDFLPEDWTYEDTIGANAAVAKCIRGIVESAFGHPELSPLPAAQGGR